MYSTDSPGRSRAHAGRLVDIVLRDSVIQAVVLNGGGQFMGPHADFIRAALAPHIGVGPIKARKVIHGIAEIPCAHGFHAGQHVVRNQGHIGVAVGNGYRGKVPA